MYYHMGDVVRELRHQKGWTQEQLADFAGVKRKCVMSIELTGLGRITSLERILGVMGYELEAVPTNVREMT